MRTAVPFRSFARGRSLSRVLVALAGCIIAFMLAWFGFVVVGAERAGHEAAEHTVEVADLRGRITYLNELVTMSVRMAAASGDTRWSQRFEDAVPALDAAIAAAADLATPDARASLASTMIEAHRDLLQMERRAIALVAGQQQNDARDLLNGPEFAYLQDVYASGMEVFGEDLRGEANRRAASLNARIWLQTLGFGIGVIALVATVMTLGQRRRLRVAADTDALTLLPNRRHFYAHLSEVLGSDRQAEEPRRALLLIGIDQFKHCNDAYGHAVADRLLQLVAVRLRAVVAARVFPARMGGDEFALLLDSTPPGMTLRCVADGIMTTLAKPFRLEDGTEISLGFSGGLVLMEADVADAGDVMRRAGLALRQAKFDGRNRLREFDHALEVRTRARALLEGDLRRAIDRDEIVPFFQPLVDLGTNMILGVETLARWHHAELGWVSPANFIPIAEDLGLMGQLTERLLEKACRDALPWPAHVTVAFNVSPLQLRDNALPGQIRSILARTGFPAERLEIEVTESALVQDLDLARQILEELRRDGVRLALDDFGTGYSSLKHLRCLPFDKLKIDASFVGGMLDNRDSGSIVAAVVALGHSLGLTTVAEGVETPQVADLLRELGCDIGQGWLYGRPAPAATLLFPDPPALPPGLAA